MRKVLCIAVILSCGISRAQLPNGRTHPELRWRSFKTSHFEIIFHQGLDSLASDAANVAEEVYGPITENLGVEPRGRTSLILSDIDDISNGIANPLNHSIFIWTQSDKKETTGTLHWLRRVVGHEFAHMVNFWGCRNFLGKPWELLTLGLTPTWFIEGVAQYESEEWDDHRDLLLRTAVRDDAVLPPRKLDGFVGADIIDSRLVYEEGHGLVRFIASRYGKEKVGELIRNHRKFPLSFTWTMKRMLGKTTGNLYKEWKRDVQNAYAPLHEDKEYAQEMGEQIRVPLQVVTGLRWSPDGMRMAVVGMERWDEGVQRLYVCDVDGSRFRSIGRSHVGSYFSWSPDGKKIVISRKRRGEHGSFVDDLFVVDAVSGKEKRITTDLRATDPSWSPAREEICFVRHSPGRSTLWRRNLKNENAECVLDLGRDTEVFSPSWSPDGEKIVFSLFDKNGHRDIAVVNRDGTGFKKLTDDSVDDRTPAWSPDGESVAFCSYEGGTPNLFRMRPDGTKKTRMTDAAGGVFNPAWTPDGRAVSAVIFEKRNSVNVTSIPADRRVEEKPVKFRPAWTSVEPPGKYEIPPNEEKIPVMESSSYRSLAHVRPLITFPFLGLDDAGTQVGLIHYASDPLYKHQILGTITARKRVDWRIEYTNGQFEPVITLTCWGRTRDRGEFLLRDAPRLWERRSGADIRLSLPVNFGRTLLSNHLFYVLGRAERIQLLHPDRFSNLSPSFRPFAGWINAVGLGYAWAWGRPDVGFGVHPSTGISFHSSFQHAGQFLGSDIDQTRIESGAAYRQELPFKRHVIAARIGSFFQWGDQPIQDGMSLPAPGAIRGLSRSKEGDRFLYGSVEYRVPLIRDLGFRVPVLYFERFAGSFWMDCGKAWGRNLTTYETGEKRGFREGEWAMTAGVELRCRIYLWGKLPVLVRGGFGRDIIHGEKGNWYCLIGPFYSEWMPQRFHHDF